MPCSALNLNILLCVCVLEDKRAHQHLHDPDRCARQPPERQGHTHAADQSLHAGGGELHREVPAMHHGRLHDVPHHQVIWTDRLSLGCAALESFGLLSG